MRGEDKIKQGKKAIKEHEKKKRRGKMRTRSFKQKGVVSVEKFVREDKAVKD